jgi:hypothetical protein
MAPVWTAAVRATAEKLYYDVPWPDSPLLLVGYAQNHYTTKGDFRPIFNFLTGGDNGRQCLRMAEIIEYECPSIKERMALTRFTVLRSLLCSAFLSISFNAFNVGPARRIRKLGMVRLLFHRVVTHAIQNYEGFVPLKMPLAPRSLSRTIEQ